MSCVFCEVWNGKLPADIVCRASDTMAFHSIAPEAPTHIIVITADHFPTLREVPINRAARLMWCIQDAIAALKLSSYRVVFNAGPDAGQTVAHVHAHVLAGAPLGGIVSSAKA